MTRVAEGEACTGRERLFVEMAIACHQRDPTRQKTLVCLMDGEAALWNVQREWLGRAVGVLDLFHVLERLWQAAHVLHREGSPAAEQFVTQDLRLLLQGKVGQVIGRLTRLRDEHALGRWKRHTLSAIIGYYQNNRQHMKYDQYLAAGYPIGSGVAEAPADTSSKIGWNKRACAGTSTALRPCSTCGPFTSMAIGTTSSTTAFKLNKPRYTGTLRHSGMRVTPLSFLLFRRGVPSCLNSGTYPNSRWLSLLSKPIW